jgi:hypothetical protein
METREIKHEKKEIYLEPKIIASYTKEELEETIKPHGQNFNGYVDRIIG